MGETRVDLLHLLEDLRDAYPWSLEETILTEIIANSLDSGATTIQILADPVQSTLTVVDNGSGMRRRDLSSYHDIAASTKVRGQGIGFAGVGIKLGLLLCEEVLTETRRGKTHVATIWHLASRHRAPWKWMPPSDLVAKRGTAVRLKLLNALSPLLDPGFIENALRRHFQPLLDPAFDDVLAPHYPHGIALELNGAAIEKQEWAPPIKATVEIRMLRKRKPSAAGYLIRDAVPLPEEQRGIAISTLGKVIKRGWEWLGISPAAPERTAGAIEVPALASCLTLDKANFIRVGPRGAVYLAYRKAIQEAVSRQLTRWGDMREPVEEAMRRVVRPLERDLEGVIEDLAKDFPLLASLVEHRPGGQRKLPIGTGAGSDDPNTFVRASLVPTPEQAETRATDTMPSENRQAEGQAEREPAEPEHPREQQSGVKPVALPARDGHKRPAHYGLSIQLEERPADPELGRLIESTVWVNQAHPAYHRAGASRSMGYHISLAVAMALAPLAVEPAKEHGFVTAFLSAWGQALESRKNRGKRRR